MKLPEDYTALILSVILIFIASTGVVFWFPSLSWNNFSELVNVAGSLQWVNLLVLFALSYLIIWIASVLKGEALSFSSIQGYFFIFFITFLAHSITAFGPAKELGLEIVIFSLLIGLFISNFLKVPHWVKPLLQTEQIGRAHV